MKLSDIFNQLTHGELSQLNIGGAVNGEIPEANQLGIAHHIQLGLTALYKRFNLKEGRLTLQLEDDVTLYHLRSRFAVNGKNTTEILRYIIDTEDAPFRDDIIKVEQVLSDFEDTPFNLNDHSDRYTCSTPTLDSLRVHPEIVRGGLNLCDWMRTDQLTIVYRAAHPNVVSKFDYFDPEHIRIELPDSHLEALLLFVASRVNNPIGMTNEFHAGNSYAAKYEQECAKLEGQNIQVDRGRQNTKLRSRGFV